LASLAAAFVLAAEFWTGPRVQVPILFVFPVLMASWYGFIGTGLFLALALPLARALLEVMVWRIGPVFPYPAINAGARIVVLVVLGVLARRAGIARRLEERVNVLEGLLPICSFCKRIRDADDRWQPVEKYIMERSGAVFSHGLCAKCAQEHYGMDEQTHDKAGHS
jgi:hypothetical protein